MSRYDTEENVVLNEKIYFLLNPFTIKQLANGYRWALRSAKELDNMSDEELQEIREYQRDVDYIEMAVELANRQFKETLQELELDDFLERDLKRSYDIEGCRVPEDRLGIIYHWVISNTPLTISDEEGRTQKPLSNYEDVKVIHNELFDRFINWSDEHEYLIWLTKGEMDAVGMGTLRKTFVDVLNVVLQYNPSLRELFSECKNA